MKKKGEKTEEKKKETRREIKTRKLDKKKRKNNRKKTTNYVTLKTSSNGRKDRRIDKRTQPTKEIRTQLPLKINEIQRNSTSMKTKGKENKGEGKKEI